MEGSLLTQPPKPATVCVSLALDRVDVVLRYFVVHMSYFIDINRR